MKEHYQNVREFMKLGGQRYRDTLDRTAPRDLRILGAKLILEETKEVCAELGVNVDIVIKDVQDIGMVDTGKLAKELADLHVVTTWNQLVYGIPWQTQMQVDMNNLSKFEPGWSKNEYGKVIPAPGFCKLKECDCSVKLQE